MQHRLKATAIATAALTGVAVLLGSASASAASDTDTTPPSVPANVTYTPDLDTGAIHWELSTDDVTPRFETRYRIYYEDELVAEMYAAAANREGFDFYYRYYAATDPLVFNGEYTITAVDAAGNESAPSEPVVVDNLVDLSTDTTPPPAPANLARTGLILNVWPGSLEWDASIDDLTAVHYQVYRDGEPIQLQDSLYYTHPTMVDLFTEIFVCINEEFQPGEYTVTAIDRAGNESAPSNAVNITQLI